MNSFKTFILLFTITVLFLLIGNMIGGTRGMIIAFMFAVLTNFISYWFSDKIVLSMYGAKEVTKESEPKLYQMVSELAESAKIPVPKIYYIRSSMPNAFATGRNPEHAVVAVTDGILQLLNERELRGVISHEISHIKNRDILISCVAAALAGAIMILARFAFFFGGSRDDNGGSNPVAMLLMFILAPVAAMLIQMAISRSREYIADSSGAAISKDPAALASALRKLTLGNEKLNNNVSPQTAHMFIVTPFSSRSAMHLFSTHPPIEERIKKLEKMAETAENEKYKTPKVIY
ncbi:MAG: zinc metalloprotease HtpX [Endomicrobiaceae bacterium]|jgi:heat shock protein HtpX|nr:zinc metalloprotease HtpX [Endomicrobiaceae bacterium]